MISVSSDLRGVVVYRVNKLLPVYEQAAPAVEKREREQLLRKWIDDHSSDSQKCEEKDSFPAKRQHLQQRWT